ncbi:AI-2E family transporter [Chryseobacterium sp. T1]
MMNAIKLPFIVKLSLVVVSIIGIGYLIKLGQSILAPFFLAFLLAMLFVPISNFMEKKFRFSRGLSSIFSVLIMVLIICGLGYFFTSQLANFSEDIPKLSQQFETVFHNIQVWVSKTFNLQINKQFEYINEAFNKLLSSTGLILGFTFSIFSSGIGFLFFCLLFFIFILNYRRVLNTFIINVFDAKHELKVQEIVTEIQMMTKKYITGLLIQVVIVSILSSLMLTILGVKYAILLGVLTGLLNVIPYIGVLISLVISMFIAFATGEPITCLYVAIGYIAVHAIDGNLVLPFVVGSKVKINALFSFIGILVGEHLWGISGMFLCIPAMAIFKIIFERIEPLKPWGKLLGEDEK